MRLFGRRREDCEAAMWLRLQPEAIKLTDNGVRKLLLRAQHGQVTVEIEVPDPAALTSDVQDVQDWIRMPSEHSAEEAQ